MNNNIRHFYGSQLIIHLISLVMSMSDKDAARSAMGLIPEYTSRGHGRSQFKGFAIKPSRSIYQPHQGEQEIARRLSHLEAAK